MPDDLNPSPPLEFDQPAFEATLTDSIPDMPEALPARPAGESSAGASLAARSPEPTPAASGSQAAAPAPWAGKMLGRFRLMRLLGEGMMGRVIMAEDVHLHRVVALKVLRTQIRGMNEAERVNHFLREARAAAQLDHPNVVRIFEINEHQGWWYIAMEMLEGQTLKQIVDAVGPLPPLKACAIIADAADGLAAAHAAGIIHRDIKPNNLMMTRTGRCKLTDFGLVHFEDPTDPFTRHNKGVGTPQYMAPEAIRREAPSPAIDIYSLGATLYFALTGKPPFETEDLREALRHHLASPPPDPRKLSPAVSESLAKFVMRTMDKDPAKRPSAMELAGAMRFEMIGLAGDEGSSMIGGVLAGLRPPPPPRPAWHTWVRRAATAGIGAVVALAAYLWFTGEGDQPDAPPRVAIESLFPNAPKSYGVRRSGELPAATKLEPQPFSWKGKRDPAGRQFIGSRHGRYYYRPDDPRTNVIRDDEFMTFKDEAEAKMAGRVAAP